MEADLDAQNAFGLQLQREQSLGELRLRLDGGVEEANGKIKSCVEYLLFFNITWFVTPSTANICAEYTYAELLSTPTVPEHLATSSPFFRLVYIWAEKKESRQCNSKA